MTETKKWASPLEVLRDNIKSREGAIRAYRADIEKAEQNIMTANEQLSEMRAAEKALVAAGLS